MTPPPCKTGREDHEWEKLARCKHCGFLRRICSHCDGKGSERVGGEDDEVSCPECLGTGFADGVKHL